MKNIIVNIFYLLLFLLNFNCAIMIFSRIGNAIGRAVDTLSTKEIKRRDCTLNEMASKMTATPTPLKSLKYKAIGSGIGHKALEFIGNKKYLSKKEKNFVVSKQIH